MTRTCGDCQICCRILPVRELGKGHDTRCTHQKFAKGCSIYAQRPLPCRLWSCLWLLEEAGEAMRRPDRAGYVVDIMPDTIVVQTEEGNRTMTVVQIWADPKRPYSYRDPALMEWLAAKYASAEVLGLVRFDPRRAVVLLPPALTGGDWVEMHSTAGDVEKAA